MRANQECFCDVFIEKIKEKSEQHPGVSLCGTLSTMSTMVGKLLVTGMLHFRVRH